MRTVHVLLHRTSASDYAAQRLIRGFDDEAEANTWRDALKDLINGALLVVPLQVQATEARSGADKLATLVMADMFGSLIRSSNADTGGKAAEDIKAGAPVYKGDDGWHPAEQPPNPPPSPATGAQPTGDPKAEGFY